MKIIDLITMRAEDKEMPKKIRIDHWCYKFEWIEHDENYYDKHNDIDLMSCLSMSQEELNYEVKIINEETKPLMKKDVEALGYACGEIKKCFENGWNKSLENKPFEEDKKIEKINCRTFEFMHKPDKVRLLMNKINEIIDYLEDKDE